MNHCNAKNNKNSLIFIFAIDEYGQYLIIIALFLYIFSPNFRVAFVTFADSAVVHLNLTRIGNR